MQVPGVSYRLDLAPAISVYVFGVTGEGYGCVSMSLDGQLLAKVRLDRELRTLFQDCGLSVTLKVKFFINSELIKPRHLRVTQTPSIFQNP